MAETQLHVFTYPNIEPNMRDIDRMRHGMNMAWSKFQFTPETCRKFSRYARKDFHLMTELSA